MKTTGTPSIPSIAIAFLLTVVMVAVTEGQDLKDFPIQGKWESTGGHNIAIEKNGFGTLVGSGFGGHFYGIRRSDGKMLAGDFFDAGGSDLGKIVVTLDVGKESASTDDDLLTIDLFYENRVGGPSPSTRHYGIASAKRTDKDANYTVPNMTKHPNKGSMEGTWHITKWTMRPSESGEEIKAPDLEVLEITPVAVGIPSQYGLLGHTSGTGVIEPKVRLAGIITRYGDTRSHYGTYLDFANKGGGVYHISWVKDASSGAESLSGRFFVYSPESVFGTGSSSAEFIAVRFP